MGCKERNDYRNKLINYFVTNKLTKEMFPRNVCKMR